MRQERDLPTLQTPRLLLRPLTMNDGPRVRELAGHPDVARTTMSLPHPYPEGAAEEWISQHDRLWRGKGHAIWGITCAEQGLIGCMSLIPNFSQQRAELAYWIGRDFWNQGYATEAGRAVMNFAFDDLKLNRVYAMHHANNPASGRVMEKLGMQREGLLREHFFKNGEPIDAIYYGRLRVDK